MDAIVISIGEELVSGQAIDTNSAWLSVALGDLGVTILRHVTVRDERGAIASAFREAIADADVVVSTGGLGPTADDLTRFALAAVLGAPIERSEEAERQIRAFFERWQRPFRDANLVQADMPRGSTVLANPRGTAPGIHCRVGDCAIYALPGVPPEMEVMFAQHIAPELAARGSRTLRARLRCFGITEATLGELLADLMGRDRNPLVGTTASAAVLTVRISASGSSENEARSLLEQDVAAVRGRLGDVVFGEDDDGLENAVGRLLVERGQTVAVAESCTGGLLGARLTDVPGASQYFLQGAITYTDASKTEVVGVPAELIAVHGAVSEQVASAMARGGHELAGSDYCLALTGIAGPAGGDPPDKPVGLVYIALASASGTEVRRMLLGEHLSRGEIRDRSVKTALNMLRLRMLRADGAPAC